MIHIHALGDQTEGSEGSVPEQSWIHVVQPTDEELAQLVDLGISTDLLEDVRDPQERSRLLQREQLVQVVVRLPFAARQSEPLPYITVPISILLLPKRIVTIEAVDIGLMELVKQLMPHRASPTEQIRFVLAVLTLAATEYLGCLGVLTTSIEEIEDRLQRSLRNREVLQLLNIQKSLVYFATALRSIETLVERLRAVDLPGWSIAEDQLAEDGLIEIRQALYHVEITENILTQMMDAFASIVSNNLNTVMKFLAAITIVISVPMLIASLYGMNVSLPGANQTSAFAVILIASLILSVLVIALFRKLDWL